jgi:predicted enzyme related to lactoylglutathione lyase
MTETATRILNKVAWVDLAAKDAAAARDFYDKVLGWTTEVNPDPQYGGYGRARVDGKDVAGIGPAQSPDQQSAWSVYIGTDDLDGLSKRITDAGGTVIAPAFDVGDQGRMAVFRDPAGAFISSWEAHQMGGFQTNGRSAFGWADLNARNVEGAIPFYATVFGWTPKTTGTPDRPYTEFQVDGTSIAGATEMDPRCRPRCRATGWSTSTSTTWMRPIAHGSTGAREPSRLDFPGGRMLIVSDLEGAAFGLMTLPALDCRAAAFARPPRHSGNNGRGRPQAVLPMPGSP